MKTPLMMLALLSGVFAGPALASDYWARLECDWRAERPEIEAATSAAEALLQAPCDADLNAQTQHRFRHLERQSLALYNRGLISGASSPAALEAAPNLIEPVRTSRRLFNFRTR